MHHVRVSATPPVGVTVDVTMTFIIVIEVASEGAAAQPKVTAKTKANIANRERVIFLPFRCLLERPNVCPCITELTAAIAGAAGRITIFVPLAYERLLVA